MREHLTNEQIAAMLDEPHSVPGAIEHLETCERCATEFEGMSRMRMALSALPDLEAPAGQWERIRGALPDDDVGPAADGVRPLPVTTLRRTWSSQLSNPLIAAAILVLFFAGLLVGRALTPGPSTSGADGLVADAGTDSGLIAAVDEDPAVTATAAEYPEYFNTIRGLQELRDQSLAELGPGADPAAVAERLTRIDALIDASREALQQAPADPALNDFLFDMYDRRSSLSGQLDQSLRQASMEY